MQAHTRAPHLHSHARTHQTQATTSLVAVNRTHRWGHAVRKAWRWTITRGGGSEATHHRRVAGWWRPKSAHRRHPRGRHPRRAGWHSPHPRWRAAIWATVWRRRAGWPLGPRRRRPTGGRDRRWPWTPRKSRLRAAADPAIRLRFHPRRRGDCSAVKLGRRIFASASAKLGHETSVLVVHRRRRTTNARRRRRR